MYMYNHGFNALKLYVHSSSKQLTCTCICERACCTYTVDVTCIWLTTSQVHKDIILRQLCVLDDFSNQLKWRLPINLDNTCCQSSLVAKYRALWEVHSNLGGWDTLGQVLWAMQYCDHYLGKCISMFIFGGVWDSTGVHGGYCPPVTSDEKAVLQGGESYKLTSGEKGSYELRRSGLATALL